jgi:DNA-binding CsgD family transcriptional regulator
MAEALYTQLHTPTLVLHARDYALYNTSTEEGIRKAQWSRGRLVMIDGTDVWGDPDQGIRAIEAFLGELTEDVYLPSTNAAAHDLLPRVTTQASSSSVLSPREMEILRLVAAGKSSREIGETLVLSIRTVERHIANIYLKTETHGRAQVTAYAIAQGIV